MKKQIAGKCFDEERALYHLQNTELTGCCFAGPADGESALKESLDITVRDCRFSLRYPLWHSRRFLLESSSLDALTRAPVWYAEEGVIRNCTIEGIKCLRECDRMEVYDSLLRSPEFGWKCRGLTMVGCEADSEYFLFESRDIEIDRLRMSGKYSFQYVENMHIRCSELATKDAFWHSQNVTVEDSLVKGEYLGWYSEGLTLIRCRIIGTQPLCYCKGLRLIDCTMEETDLSFEYSEVEAEIKGKILSVKNPRSGRITADAVGEIIQEDSIMESGCRIEIRAEKRTLDSSPVS
ncbi:MAG: DUF3737 family protein [Clostridiales bacterium]|nr:DUF3737 family protein [Clostridiales bacterium]